MIICIECLKKYDESTNKKQGDNCTNKKCIVGIIELEDILYPMLIEFRKKHYRINLMNTGEFDSAGFMISLYPFQCTEHFPSLPKGFTITRNGDSVMLIRKLTNTDPVKRHQEVINIIDEVLEWINELPVIRILATHLFFSSKAEIEELKNELFGKNIFFGLPAISQEQHHFTITGFRVIQMDDVKEEKCYLRYLLKKSKPFYIHFRLLPEIPLKGI